MNTIFITDSNILIPLQNIDYKNLYSHIEKFTHALITLVKIVTHTIYFICSQAILEIMEKSSPIEKMLIILFLYEFFMMTYNFYKLNKRNTQIEKEIKIIQDTITYLKINEKAQEFRDKSWILEWDIFKKGTKLQIENIENLLKEYKS